MKSDLLPHEVTWYHLTGAFQGVPEYRRTVLCPVRCETVHRRPVRDGNEEDEAILYVFPDELHGLSFTPEPEKDFFVPGISTHSVPGKECYRVWDVKYYDGIPRMRHFRITGAGRREGEGHG